MSIRAHRIIEIKLAENSSFKVWDDSRLTQYLEEHAGFLSNLNSNGTGQAEVPISILMKALKISNKLGIDEKTKRFIQEDIEFANANDNSYVIYDCF